MTLREPLHRLFRTFGFDIIRPPRTVVFPPDFDRDTVNTILAVQAYTLTSPERIFALCEAIRYLVANRIQGDFVECGVWKGGSVMAIARELLRLGDRMRHLYLFDTFEGMPPSGTEDRHYTGIPASVLMEQHEKGGKKMLEVPLDEVRLAVLGTGYEATQIHFVKGRVEDTLPQQAPSTIALLRLDTDWYESTKHELMTLFPRVVPGGILIIDDYGHFAGARKAVDEYIREHRVKILLCRADYSGRVGVVQS